MKVGDTMIVVRVPAGEKPPKGFKHSDAAKASHHGRHSTHAVRLLKRKGKKK